MSRNMIDAMYTSAFVLTMGAACCVSKLVTNCVRAQHTYRYPVASKCIGNGIQDGR